VPPGSCSSRSGASPARRRAAAAPRPPLPLPPMFRGRRGPMKRSASANAVDHRVARHAAVVAPGRRRKQSESWSPKRARSRWTISKPTVQSSPHHVARRVEARVGPAALLDDHHLVPRATSSASSHCNAEEMDAAERGSEPCMCRRRSLPSSALRRVLPDVALRAPQLCLLLRLDVGCWSSSGPGQHGRELRLVVERAG